MTYDANNNLRTESLTVGSLTLNAAFGFNSLDQLTTITYPSLRQVSYAPDALGRPTQALPYLTSVAHHPNGVPKTLNFGNGHTTTTTLTNRQWLDSTITQKTGIGQVVNLNYDYDGLANVTKITNSLDTTDTQTLTYDGLDRLLTAGTVSLTYDAPGNIRTYTTGAGTLTYGYTSNRLATVSGHTSRSYLYDNYGNTLSDGLRSMTWDDAGNLRTIGIYSHDYDGRNQRVRTRTPDGAETYTFTTQNGLTLGEYGPTGSYTREYAYLGTKLVALIDHDPYGTERASYLHPNALGSPVAATDQTGNLLWKETYQPYGERKQKQPNSTTNNRWYTGHIEDPTGLVYAGARYYDPVIGRFLSTDPVSFTEKNVHSFGRYTYGNNNPYKYFDPDGLAAQLAIHSSGNGGSSMTSGHSWIAYTPDGGKTVTLGTWGNNPTGQGNGLFTNLEQGRVGDASRSMHVDDAGERAFLDKVQQYDKAGADAWKLSAPCSTFAADAWEAGTGEGLNTHWGPISNPTTLKESIIKRNGGVNHKTIGQPNNDSSSDSGPSSSSWSSGSSIDPLKSSLQ